MKGKFRAIENMMEEKEKSRVTYHKNITEYYNSSLDYKFVSDQLKEMYNELRVKYKVDDDFVNDLADIVEILRICESVYCYCKD